MDATLRDIVDTFAAALGPFGDPGVLAVARALPDTLADPGALRVLMQGHTRVGVRPRAVLLTVVGPVLSLSTGPAPWREWPLADCMIDADDVRLAGQRLSITPPGERTVTLGQTMPVDELPRLLAAAATGDDGSVCARPPVARLGAAATLYEDRIAFADGPTHPLSAEVIARALELPGGAGTTLRTVSRLMQGARGKPRHVLIDGPGWSQVVPAPETAPELADGFAEAVNHWAPTAARRP